MRLFVCDSAADELVLTQRELGHVHVVHGVDEAKDEQVVEGLRSFVERCSPTQLVIAVSGTRSGDRVATAVARLGEQTGISVTRLPVPVGFTLAGIGRRDATSLLAVLRGQSPPEPERNPSAHSVRVEPPSATELRCCVASFLGKLSLGGAAESSLRTRAVQLRAIVRELASIEVTAPGDLNRKSVESLLARLQSRMTKRGTRVDRSTVAKDIGALRAILRWLQREGLIAVDLWSELPTFRLPDRPPMATLSIDEVERVLASVYRRSSIGLRNHAMLSLMYSSGLRRAEICALDVRDFAWDQGLVRVRHGKGGKSRVVPVGVRAVAAVMDYVETARPRCLRDIGEPALFVGRGGRRLSPKRLTALCKAQLAAAGLTGRGSCHVFRHTMATQMHDGGAGIRDLQVMLGHARLSTTQIYTQVSLARLRKVHAETHPAG